MKKFKDLMEEVMNEGYDDYPADDMTMKEVKIACYAAQKILDMMENGAMVQRWQISAIVKAAEELTSVYTSMSADEDEYSDDEWDDEEEDMYVGYEYPSMYGEETKLDEGILKPYHTITNKPWSQSVKDSKGTAGEYYQIGKGKDFTVWTGYVGSLKQYPHYVVRDDKIIGSGMTMTSALKDAGLKDSDLTARSKFSAGSVLNKGMKEATKLAEGYNDPIHHEYISKVVHEYFPKGSEKHDKIVDHLHKAKNFGTKTSDSLESHAGISIGSAMRVTKAVADELKTNFGTQSKPQTQAQRIGAYLKQKQIGPIKR